MVCSVGNCKIQHRAQDHSACGVLRLDGRGLQAGCAPAHLLGLLKKALEQFGAPEGGMPGRFLQGQHGRAKLVPEPSEEVIALLVGDPLSDLRGLARQAQPALLRPAHEPAVQNERLPVSAGRWELQVSWAVALVVGHQFHAAADADPHGRGGAHRSV